MRLGARVSGGNGLAEPTRCSVSGFLALGTAAVQYWGYSLPLPTGTFGPLLERRFDPSLGWELVEAATYPQTCAFGVGILVRYVFWVNGMWIVRIKVATKPTRLKRVVGCAPERS